MMRKSAVFLFCVFAIMAVSAQEIQFKSHLFIASFNNQKLVNKSIKNSETSQLLSKTLLVSEAGTLNDLLTNAEKQNITELIISGFLSAIDFVVLRDSMPSLKVLNLKDVHIKAYHGNKGTTTSIQSYPENEIPQQAFYKEALDPESNPCLIKSIILPVSISSIGLAAFANCTELEDIYISEHVLKIKSLAFLGSVTRIHVNELNPNYTDINGLLYTKDKKQLIYCPTSTIGDFAIPETVERVDTAAFFRCFDLKSVTIPTSVTEICDFAFYSCMNLKSVHLHVFPEHITVASYVFYGCPLDVCVLHVPFGSKQFFEKTYVWGGFSNIIENPEGFYIDKSDIILKNVNAKAEIEILSSVQWSVSCDQHWIIIQNNTGTGNDRVIITATENSQLEKREATLSFSATGCGLHYLRVKQVGTALTLDLTPGTLASKFDDETMSIINHLKLRGTIDARDFKTMMSKMTDLNYLDLQEVNIEFYQGGNGTSMNDGPFIANRIPDYAFSYGFFDNNPNLKLKEVRLPETINSVGLYAFNACYGLTEIILPDSVVTVETGAFSQCRGLRKITLGNGLKYIRSNTFNHGGRIDSILVKQEIPINLTNSNAVFGGVDKSKCVVEVPYGAVSLYKKASVWKDFANIVESPYGFVLLRDTVHFYNHETDSAYVGVLATCQWTATTNQSWLRIASETGTGNDSIKLIIETNPTGFVRTGHVLISAPGVNSKTITVIQQAAPKSVHLSEAGSLISALSQAELNEISKLIVKGNMDSRDFKTMRDNMPKLAFLDISEVMIKAYTGEGGTNYYNKANAIPQYAFSNNYNYEGKKGLISVRLPISVTTISSSSFKGCKQLEFISIPNAVSTIEISAFAECISLREVVLPVSITKLEPYLFKNCINLKQVNFPNTIQLIDFGVFDGCASLDSVFIPNSVTQIGENAFANCSGLKFVRLPDLITEIKGQTFYNCTSLESVTIPDLVTFIGYSAFENCIKLVDVNFGKSIKNFSHSVFKSCTALSGIVIPEGVNVLGMNMFKQCGSLIDVSIPNTVTSIESGVFSECSSLQEITLPVSINKINYQTFYKCNSLTKINFGNAVHTIEFDAFSNCTSLKQISLPVSVKEIGSGAFAQCSALKDVVLGDSLNVIGSRAFNLCSSLISINLPASLKKIENNTFDMCTSLSRIEIPDGISAIGEYAFSGCSAIDSIYLPVSITEIKRGTFNGCESLKTVKLSSGLRSIGESAFKLCTSLSEIELPSSLEIIGSSAFCQCTSLNKIEIPNSVRMIGYNAFENCISLTELKMGVFVNTIQGSAFRNCSNLETAIIPGKVTKIGNDAFEGCSGLISIVAHPVIPVDLSGVYSVFGGVDKSKCVLYVPHNAVNRYRNAVLWKDFSTIIENQYELYLNTDSVCLSEHQDSQTTIQVFSNTSWIVNSEIPWLRIHQQAGTGNAMIVLEADENTLPVSRFGYISVQNENVEMAVVKVTQFASVKAVKVIAGDLYNTLKSDVDYKTITRLKVEGTIDARDFKLIRDSIPDLYYLDISEINIQKYEGDDGTEGTYFRVYPENAIPQYAFYDGWYGKEKLQTILLPDNLTTIGVRAFNKCVSIDTLIIPDPVHTIGDYAFENCKNLTCVKLPSSLTTIGSLFSNCQRLSRIDIPESVTSIGNSAFSSCVTLDSVVLGSSVQSIGQGAFYNCKNLKSISLSSSLASIGNDAFSSCSSLTGMILPNSVKTIGNSVFSMCSSFRTVSIPASVTSIGNYAFSISSLDTIYVLLPTPLNLTSYSVFSNVNKSTCKMYVPKGSKELYQNADQWKDFKNIIDDRGFVLSHDTVRIQSGSDFAVNIFTKENWSATSDQSWLNISAYNGTGDATLTIEGAFNPSGLIRKGTIRVSAFGSPVQNIVVIQSEMPKIVQLSSGQLMNSLTQDELSTISHLILKGTIDVRDFKTMRDLMPQLSHVDVENATITAFSGEAVMEPMTTTYPANELPAFAFYKPYLRTGKQNLATVVLPANAVSVGRYACKYAIGLQTINIPDEVTIIGNEAFSYCKRLDKVILGNSVASIGEYAFKHCSGLRSIEFGNSLKTIAQEAFSSCYALEQVAFPESLQTIAYRAFSECRSIKSLVIPDAVVYLGSDVFSWCSSLTNVKLPESISELANGLFRFCTSLTEINIPNTLTSINTDLFQRCISLREVTIPETVTFIGSRAFAECKSLTNISIPAAVTRIDFGAFEHCTGLTDFYAYPSNPVDLSASYYAKVFNGVNKTGCKLHVPTGTKGLYASAVEWSEFLNVVEMNTDLFTSNENRLEIYPNPVKDCFWLKNISEPVNVTIFNTHGSMCLNVKVTGNDLILVDMLPVGVYIVHVFLNNKSIETLLIKE